MQLGCAITCASTMDAPVCGFSAQSLSPRAPATPSLQWPPSTALPTTHLCRAAEPGDHFPPRLEQGHATPGCPAFPCEMLIRKNVN